MELQQMSKKPATYQDIIDLPENIVGEIIDDELYTHSRPAPRHAIAASRLGPLLGPYQDKVGHIGGWLIFGEPEIHISRQILVPDLAGWRRENMPRAPKEAYFSVRPDWLAEVLSPSTARIDRLKKMRIYAQWGVSYVWLIDPIVKTLEAFTLKGESWVLHEVYSDAADARIPPFEELAMDVSLLWED